MKTHYHHIESALPLLAGEARGCWKDVPTHLGLSPFYFQRIFRRHTGVSPRQYAACITLSDIKERLAAGEDILRASVAAGLSGGGRTYDLFVTADALTPGEFGRGGAGVVIRYGRGMSPYGEMFVATTERGVCFLHFLLAGRFAAILAKLRRKYPQATLRRDDEQAADMAGDIFCQGKTPLCVRGTNFQINVWRALLALPAGAVISYQSLADVAVGDAGSARAVAGAVAANPIAVLIPCHRVLAKDGRLSGYAWGADKKRALLGREFAIHT